MRINQFISASGYCSRRAADALVLEKRVKVNGKIALMGMEVSEKDKVEVNGKRLTPKQKHVYLMLNKPRGITCTTERHVKGNIIDFIGHKERIFPVGRLDKDSEGLILLTSDGNIVNAILREEHAHTKEYLVTVDRAFDDGFLEQMKNGVVIYNPVKKKHETTKPCTIKKQSKHSFVITLSQGLNRQIRRMCQTLGYEVVALKRTRIMHLKLSGLKTGQYRPLTKEELMLLMQQIGAAQKDTDGRRI